MRDDVAQCFREGPTISFDVSMPISTMEGYVDEVTRRLAAAFDQHRCYIFGHLGDGNLHLVVGAGTPTPEVRRKVEEAVYEPLRAIGGSVSAEHGVGLEKKPYLEISREANEIALMRTLKRALDPKGILNPGKIFDAA
jgi:FAD/FMN-containing dehydrogenase